MRTTGFLLVLPALAAGPAATVAAQPPTAFQQTWQRASSALRAELTASGVVGASFWCVQGDQLLGRGFYGFADLASGRRVDEHTIFHWASITKTMTAIAALQLRDRGRLRLGDRIVDHLPELKRVHGGTWDVGQVTLRHLLSHSGGFRANTWPWGGERWQPYEPATWTQLAAMFPYSRLHFAPGSRFSYSNPGIVFVGRVIEQLTGEDYEVQVDKNILKPLGMHRSFFDNTPYHLLAQRSNNYSFVDGKLHANGLDLDTGITVSNGGLNAPIPDMLRYLRFLLDVGDRDRYRQVLQRTSLQAMWQPVHAAGKAGSYARSMGLGFFVYERDGRRVIGHTGSQRAFQCFFLADPAARTAVIAAFNSEATNRDPQRSTRAIMLRFLNTALEQLLPTLRPR